MDSESGIHNFSIDLIFGLPNQTMEDVKRDIFIFKFRYTTLIHLFLQIEENSIFERQV